MTERVQGIRYILLLVIIVLLPKATIKLLTLTVEQAGFVGFIFGVLYGYVLEAMLNRKAEQ